MKKLIFLFLLLSIFFGKAQGQTSLEAAQEMHGLMRLNLIGESMIEFFKTEIEIQLKSETATEVQRKSGSCSLAQLQADQKPINRFNLLAQKLMASAPDIRVILEIARDQLTEGYYLIAAEGVILGFKKASSEEMTDWRTRLDFFLFSNSHVLEYSKQLGMGGETISKNLQFSRALGFPSLIVQGAMMQFSLDMIEKCKAQK